MRYTLALIVVGICFCSCTKYFHNVFYYNDPFSDSITIVKGDFELYTRTLCRPQPPNRHYLNGPTLLFRPTASSERNNCVVSSQSSEVLEREYLLISKTKKKVIFITPYPPYTGKDTSGRYNLYDCEVFYDPSFVNLWYANRFHFGKLNEDYSQISFLHVHDNNCNTWSITLSGTNDQTLSINQVAITGKKKKRKAKVYSANALSQGLIFKKQTTFTLGFQEALGTPFFPGDTASFKLKEDKIYLDGNNLYFPVAKNALNLNGDTIQYIRFDGKRVSSSPISIADK